MGRSTATIRLFAAVSPSPETARSLLALVRSIDLPPHRQTLLAQVHMTVHFIGERPASDLDTVKESVERAASGIAAFALRPLRLRTLPQRGPARLLAVETDGPAPLLELHRRLAHRLAREPRSDPEDRFLPHLTLARLRQPALGFSVLQELDLPSFVVDQVVLYRSVLAPTGAEHRPIVDVPLRSAKRKHQP